MQSAQSAYLVSADPGSSEKGWAVASCDSEKGSEVKLQVLKSPELLRLIGELCENARDRPVLLALDAPIRVFGGVQAPACLAPQGDPPSTLAWPFNVNPFSQRPIERALGSAPPTGKLPLAHVALAHAVRGLIAGSAGGRRPRKERSFVQRHEGVSVLGYMGAPHAPIVRTFLGSLADRTSGGSVRVSYEVPGQSMEPGTIYVLETHPAVAMGFYAASGQEGFAPAIDTYKGTKANAGELQRLSEGACRLLCDHQGMRFEGKIETDDELDALVGLLSLLDLSRRNGDIFGTVEDGYFLVPRSPERDSFRTLWQRASEETSVIVKKVRTSASNPPE